MKNENNFKCAINQRFIEAVQLIKKANPNYTDAQLASELDLLPSNVSQIKAGKRGITLGSLGSFKSHHRDLNLDYILTGDGEAFSYQKSNMVAEDVVNYGKKTLNLASQSIPLYDVEASAGLVEVFEAKHNIIDRIRIPNLPRVDGAVHITGDSMYPLLKSGDIVIYKQVNDKVNGLFFGEMYLLSFVNDGEEYIVVKYIQKSELGNNYIKLVSYNTHHQPKDILVEDIRAIALIKASIRINTMA